MTLSSINSNNDLDFVGWVIKTPCLFYFRSVKFRYVEETRHMTLATFWRWWKLLQHVSTKDNERNLCQDLLSIGQVRDIDISTWLQGFQDKLLCLVVLSMYPSLFWKLKDKGNFKKFQFWPESLGSMLEYWYIERGLLKTPTRAWKCTRCTMQMSYFFASDFLFKNFC